MKLIYTRVRRAFYSHKKIINNQETAKSWLWMGELRISRETFQKHYGLRSLRWWKMCRGRLRQIYRWSWSYIQITCSYFLEILYWKNQTYHPESLLLMSWCVTKVMSLLTVNGLLYHGQGNIIYTPNKNEKCQQERKFEWLQIFFLLDDKT